MATDDPGPGTPQGPRPIRVGPVIGGIVLGVVASLLVQTALVIALSGLPAFAASPVLFYVVLLVPGLVGVGLLLRPQTRQAGAGLLLGLAVGSIVVAGACTALNAALMASG